jgi:hypothetical protein
LARRADAFVAPKSAAMVRGAWPFQAGAGRPADCVAKGDRCLHRSANPAGTAEARFTADPPAPVSQAPTLDFLWSPVVSPDSRELGSRGEGANLVHAVKERTGAKQLGTFGAMLEWDILARTSRPRSRS